MDAFRGPLDGLLGEAAEAPVMSSAQLTSGGRESLRGPELGSWSGKLGLYLLQMGLSNLTCLCFQLVRCKTKHA